MDITCTLRAASLREKERRDGVHRVHRVHREGLWQWDMHFNLPLEGTVDVNNKEWALRTGIKRAFCGGKHGKNMEDGGKWTQCMPIE